MYSLLPYLHHYFGSRALSPQGEVVVDGIVLGVCHVAQFCDLKLYLKDLPDLTADELAQVAAIEYPDASDRAIAIELARELIRLMPKMGAMPETIAYLCKQGYDVFGLKKKGLAI